MDIGQRIARLEKRLERMERQARLGSASIDDTSIEVRDADGSLRALVGQQSDGTTAVNVVNGPPPPQPSTPVGTSVLGGVAVSWDGTFADASPVPLDWARTEVHASTSDGFTPSAATLQSTIETAQGATVVVPTEDPVYVRLMARNTSGTASAPSAQAGPYSPSAVVATDILDGIVTEVKLANDAVTAAKIAASAVGTTEIADDAVTTAKVIAGAILAGKIAAGAVETDKLAAEAVTAAKIAALAITTDKIDANAITTAKLAAGAVDATALKADAITGKTITGGIINGAEFHSDDGAGGIVDIEDGQITLTDSTGWKMLIDPTATYPVIGWLLPNGDTAAALNGNESDDIPGLNMSSGPFTDGAVADWRWITYMGKFGDGTNGWRVRRVRQADTSRYLGGQLIAAPTHSSLSYIDSDNPSTNNFFEVLSTEAILSNGRLKIAPSASSLVCAYINATSGHTGSLIRAEVNSVSKFNVQPAGNVIAAGDVSGASLTTTGTASAGELAVTGTTWQTYTPTVSGAGSATFGTRDGWYFKIGKLVFVQTYIALSAAGTGTGTVTISLPSTPYRGSSNRRQYLPAYAGGIAAGTNSGVGGTAIGNINFTGSGAQIDQLRGPTDILIRGDNLSATAIITLSGWYREA